MHVTTKSKIKKKVLKEFSEYLPKLKFVKTKTRAEQPIDDAIDECIQDRIDCVTNAEGLILTLESGIVTQDYKAKDVCYIKFKEIKDLVLGHT